MGNPAPANCVAISIGQFRQPHSHRQTGGVRLPPKRMEDSRFQIARISDPGVADLESYASVASLKA
jgi:hypothetical protein